MDCEEIVPEATANRNACGAGAIAATMGAVEQLGATEAKILGYTNSYEIMHGTSDSADDTTVGYASVIFA
jgi:AmmeMemoRadiSam system protein B